MTFLWDFHNIAVHSVIHEMINHLLEKTLVEKVHQLVEETSLMCHSLHASERDEETLCR